MAESFVDGVQYLRVVLDSIPSLVFIVDLELRVIDINSTAKRYVDKGDDAVLKRLCGEVLHCIHQAEPEPKCGTTPFCESCILREGVTAVAKSNASFQGRHRLLHRRDGREEFAHFFVTASPLDHEGERLVVMVLQDVTELLALRQLVTMCSVCQAIRSEDGEWEKVHQYLMKRENVLTSHGLCPSCYEEQCREVTRINELTAAGSFSNFGRG
jgi:hypothetical protein